MAKTTTTEFFCDRCGVSLGAAVPRHTEAAQLTGYIMYEWSGQDVSWKELCAPCNKLVRDFLQTK